MPQLSSLLAKLPFRSKKHSSALQPQHEHRSPTLLLLPYEIRQQILGCILTSVTRLTIKQAPRYRHVNEYRTVELAVLYYINGWLTQETTYGIAQQISASYYVLCLCNRQLNEEARDVFWRMNTWDFAIAEPNCLMLQLFRTPGLRDGFGRMIKIHLRPEEPWVEVFEAIQEFVDIVKEYGNLKHLEFAMPGAANKCVRTQAPLNLKIAEHLEVSRRGLQEEILGNPERFKAIHDMMIDWPSTRQPLWEEDMYWHWQDLLLVPLLELRGRGMDLVITGCVSHNRKPCFEKFVSGTALEKVAAGEVQNTLEAIMNLKPMLEAFILPPKKPSRLLGVFPPTST